MKTLALVAVALLFSGPIALAGQETLWTGTRPNDYFDLLLLKESMERWVAIVGLIVAGVLAVVDLRENEPCPVGDREEGRGRVQRDQAALRHGSRSQGSSADRESAIAESERCLPDDRARECGALEAEVNHGRHGKTHGRHQTSSGLFAFASLWLAKMNVKRSLSRAFRTIPCFP
jgi:hypothetical protein